MVVAANMEGHEPFCVGVVASGHTPPEWQHEVLSSLGGVVGARTIALPGPAPRSPSGAWALVCRRRRLLCPRPLPACDPRDASPRIDLLVDLAEASDSAGSHPPSPETWRLCDGLRRPLSAPFPGLCEITSGAGGAVSIQRVGETGAIRSATFAASPAYIPDLDRLYLRAAQLVAQAVRDRVHGIPGRGPPVALPSPGRRLPAVAHLAAGACRAALRRAESWFTEDSWMIGVVDTPIARVLTEPIERVAWLGKRRRSSYLADPFGVPGDPERLYCEELCTSSGVGRIRELVVRQARIESARDVELPHARHTSYPYLFEDGGSLYCVPEAIGDRHCLLLRLDGARWTPVAEPLGEGIAAADPTIFRWQGRYWLAYTDVDDGPFDTLSLCYAERLTGPWLRHANNPVKVDHASARPGGTPFVHGGELYRPGQDCSGVYGRAVVVHRVTLCSPLGFREEPVCVLRPERHGLNPDGLHTLSAWGERTLIDGNRHRFNSIAVRRKVASRIRALFTLASSQVSP